MTLEQVRRHDVDQLRLLLEDRQHIGREAGRHVPLTRDPWPFASRSWTRSGVSVV
jgi:hypothetical protein